MSCTCENELYKELCSNECDLCFLNSIGTCKKCSNPLFKVSSTNKFTGDRVEFLACDTCYATYPLY
jgi:hypothetical protein